MDEINKARAEQMIDKFCKEFFERFATTPKVIVNYKKEVPPISLLELETLVNLQFEETYPDLYNKELGIRQKSRKTEACLFRSIFYYLGREYKFTLTQIATQVSFDHCSVLHGLKKLESSTNLFHKTQIEKVEERVQIFLNN